VKTSRPQPEVSAALLPGLLMAGYLGGTRLAAQLCSLARSTVLPASVRGARPAVFGTWGRIGRRASLHVPAGIRKVIML
jgi:hypothetical protein